ncbi:hypothetical protein B7698_08650 [Streptococcus mitis]|uniref:Phage protein n=2 Tax=Streptococcus mitis TaxID=28037 RepID=A0A1X1K221_STRMT|nr:DUF1642 domain-containing protein [Streptococcus mitis]ORO93478.1 hypothetical protein B7698_08650 [Streptococcus mitis]
MGFDKQELIKGYLRTIEQNEEKIIEYSKSCDSSKRRIRALERDLLKKRNKELRKLRNWKMNKQELIEKYKSYEGKWNAKRAELARQIFIEDLKLLEEPRKVKVKKFVADWYEEHKDEFEYNVWDWLSSKSELGKIDSKFAFWLNDVDNTPIQTLVNMHQFGYEVEKEKRYRISMPKARNYMNHAQFLCEKDGKIFWCGEWHPFRTKFTRKQLEEAGFGWVFDCPGIEIEEVE